MTSVEVHFRYATHPTEAIMFALGKARDVYGIRCIRFDRQAQTVVVEYDATRLNAATVQQLLRRTGLNLEEEHPVLPPQTEEQAAPAQ